MSRVKKCTRNFFCLLLQYTTLRDGLAKPHKGDVFLKKKPNVSADALLDTLLLTADVLVRTLHESVSREGGEKAELRSIKEWTSAAKELTALVRSLSERETQNSAEINRITVRFLDAEEFTK